MCRRATTRYNPQPATTNRRSRRMTGESPRDASLLLRLEFVFMWIAPQTESIAEPRVRDTRAKPRQNRVPVVHRQECFKKQEALKRRRRPSLHRSTQAEVQEHHGHNNRQACRDRNAGFRPPFRHGLERISRFEHRVGDCTPKPRITTAADHREQAFMHLLDRLILRSHGYSTNVAVTWRSPSAGDTIRKTVGMPFRFASSSIGRS